MAAIQEESLLARCEIPIIDLAHIGEPQPMFTHPAVLHSKRIHYLPTVMYNFLVNNGPSELLAWAIHNTKEMSATCVSLLPVRRSLSACLPRQLCSDAFVIKHNLASLSCSLTGSKTPPGSNWTVQRSSTTYFPLINVILIRSIQINILSTTKYAPHTYLLGKYQTSTKVEIAEMIWVRLYRMTLVIHICSERKMIQIRVAEYNIIGTYIENIAQSTRKIHIQSSNAIVNSTGKWSKQIPYLSKTCSK